MKQILSFIFLFFALSAFSQPSKDKYIATNLPDDLKQNANIIVRYEGQTVEIQSLSTAKCKFYKVITVLNENGAGSAAFAEGYDKFSSIDNVSGAIYDAEGNKIKKIKRKDMLDQSYYESFIVPVMS